MYHCDDQSYRDLTFEERWVFHILELTLQTRELAGVTVEELIELIEVNWSVLRWALLKIGRSGLLVIDAQGEVFTIKDPRATERPKP